MVCVCSVGIAVANVFLTELRSDVMASTGDGSIMPSIDDVGWGWVESNPVTEYLITTRIGGTLAFLFGAGAGLLGEAEADMRRQNAESIYEEMVRRRSQNESASSKKNKKKRFKKATTSNAKGMQKQTGKQRKRQADMTANNTSGSTKDKNSKPNACESHG